MLDKFRKGAQKAGIQATAFLKEGSNKLANESQHFVQGFTLPGEAEKAAKILESFLGAARFCFMAARVADRMSQLTRTILNLRSTRFPKPYWNELEVGLPL